VPSEWSDGDLALAEGQNAAAAASATAVS
jgi:hypothetical protein